MIRFLADEDFNNRIVRGLRRRVFELDVVRVQEAGLTGWSDPEILARAATENRLLLTHDCATMLDFAYLRIADGLPMPGVVAVPQELSIGMAIDDIIFLASASYDNEWNDQVVFLPLK